VVVQHHPLVRLPGVALDRAGTVAGRIGVPLLRYGLALVYVWFGILKLTGHSDVFGLVAVTVPFVNPHVFVPALGVIETLLGIGLLVPKARRLVLIGVAAHLIGTFLTFIDAPSWMVHGANPLLLTADGEFVLKNLILIGAALTLLGLTATSRVAAVPNVPVPRTPPEVPTSRTNG
jgi:uncharacterized membrane protein YkgB